MGASPKKRKPRSHHDPAYRALCAMMRKLREDNGLTQRELAERLSQQRSYVWKVESAERRLDAVEFIRWCRGCGVEAEGVFGELVKVVVWGKVRRDEQY